MASGGYDGSDSVPNCSFCPDHENKTVDGFCVDCLQYMCQDCFTIHCKFGQMKNHKFIEKDEMPLRNISPDTIDITCECKSVEHDANYFCEGHQKLLCTICLTTAHKYCTFLPLSECSKNVENSENYSKLLKELNEAEQLFQTNKTESKKNREVCAKSFEEVHIKLKCLKKRLQATLDAVNALEEKTISASKEHERKFEDIGESNTRAVHDIRSKRHDLSALQKMSQRKRLFVAVHRSKSFLRDLKQNMANINKSNIQQTYVFVPNEYLESALSQFLEVGKVMKLVAPNGNKTVGASECQLYPEYGFPKCIETANKNIIVIDSVSKVLKRIDNEGIIDHIKLSSCPWDIANVSDTSVVVSQPNEDKISFVTLDSVPVRISKEINVNCKCEGVAYANNKVYIASSKPPAIIIYDVRKCKEEQRIENNADDQSGFQQPAYIDVHPEKQLLCVSDRKSNKVFVFNCSGYLSRVFESDDMKMPLCVSFRNDNIVVVGYESGTISIISLDERKTNRIDTRFMKNLRIEKVFSDSTFVANECWRFSIVKYLSLICKNTALRK